jgi:hypothetical protein
MPHTIALVLAEKRGLGPADPKERPGPVGEVGVLTGEEGVTGLLFC